MLAIIGGSGLYDIDGLEDGVVETGPDAYATRRDQVSRLRRLSIDLREAAAVRSEARRGMRKGNIAITAKTVNITEARETGSQSSEQKFKQSGVTVAVTSPVISALQMADKQLQAAGNTSSSRMQALAGANAAINLAPDLLQKADIARNAIELAQTAPGLERLARQTLGRIGVEQAGLIQIGTGIGISHAAYMGRCGGG